MQRITIDDALAKKLDDLLGTYELCDNKGNVLGRFTRKFDPSKWEIVGGEPTHEELDRLSKSTEPRYSTEEVIAYLETLDV